MISTAAKFCEHAYMAIENYPCHLNFEYDDKKIKVLLHYNYASVCPFDVIEELDTLKLEFGDLSNWSNFYVRQREMLVHIDGFKKEFEFISFNLGDKK